MSSGTLNYVSADMSSGTLNYVLYSIHEGGASSDSVSHNRVQVLSIPVLLLACSQHWTCKLQMIVSFEAKGTNTYNRYAMCPTRHFWDL